MSAFDHAVSSSASAREANETRDRSIARRRRRRRRDGGGGARETTRGRREHHVASCSPPRRRLGRAAQTRARFPESARERFRGTDDDDDARDDRDGAERDDEDDEGDERMIPSRAWETSRNI